MAEDSTSTETEQNTTPAGDTGSEQSTETTSTDTTPAAETGGAETDWRAKYNDAVAQSRKWEERAKSNKDKAARWDEAEAANQTEHQRLTARAEKAESQRTQAIAAAVRAEIRAAARGWADPSDAPRYIDDLTTYVSEDGEIDSAAISKDVAKILKDRPHLAPAAGEAGRSGPAPDAGQGARGGSLAEQIRAAEAAGDTRTALALKARQLLHR